MKLLYITNGINGSGGLERVLSIKASLLAEDYGYDITILSLNNGNDTPFYEFSSKISFKSIPVKGNLFNYIQQYRNGMRSIVDETQPDVITVCDDGLKGFFVPKILQTNIPIIYERHASISLSDTNSLNDRIRKKLMRILSSTFNKFVVLTPSNILEWPRNKNIIAIPNPVSFYPLSSSNLKNKKVIAVGTHSYNKGYDMLLKAWKLLYEKQNEWELHIYGKIDKEKSFIKLASKLELNESVYFHEPHKNIQEKYLDSSFLVLSSRTEGFGMVIIEAMACGLPCISFDCPSGPGDIISHGSDGYLITPDDFLSFSKAMDKLMSDNMERERLGSNAKKKAKEYLPKVIVDKWNNLFKSL